MKICPVCKEEYYNIVDYCSQYRSKLVDKKTGNKGERIIPYSKLLQSDEKSQGQ